MTKSIYTIAFALVLGATGALANGNNNTGGDSCRGNCPQEGGNGPVEQTQGQLQGQAQGQSQGQELNNANKNINNNQASAGAISGSSSDSTATGIGVGGTSVVGVAVKTGPTVSGSKSNAEGGAGGDGGKSYASGGTSYAKGGDSRSNSEGGDADARVGNVTSRSGDSASVASNGGNTTGDNTITVEGDSYVEEHDYGKMPASSAASVYAQICQSGGSAQGRVGGFAVVNSEPMCEHLKLAAVYQELYLWEIENGQYVCQKPMEGHAVKDMGATHSDLCVNPRAEKFYSLYIEHMDDAELLSDKTEEAGLVDKFTGYLIRPMALIGALIWLI